MSQTLLPHLSLPLYFWPTCQLHCYLMALLVEAEMGEERKADADLSIHGPNLYLRKKKNLVSASFQAEWKSFPSLVQERGLQQWKWDKNKKSVEIRVFHPPLRLFQSTWTPEPMQETAQGSGGRAAGGQPSVSLCSSGQICSLVEKLWTSVTPATMQHIIEKTNLSSLLCSLLSRVHSVITASRPCNAGCL